jgi:LysM repeat protein
MKLTWPPSLKIPGLRLHRDPRPMQTRPGRPPKPTTVLHRARSRAVEMDEYEEEQPTTRLSTAFIVVVALHLVAVGGIYAFNSIKANRAAIDTTATEKQPVIANKVSAPKVAPGVVEKPVMQDAAPAPAAAPVQTQAPRTAATSLPIGGNRIHPVKAGDTLTKIAAQHGTTPAELAQANGIKENASLRPGQVLNLPAAKSGGASPADARKAFLKQAEEAPAKKAGTAKVIPKTHTIGKNETLMAVVRKYGVAYDELVKLNKIDDPRKLQIGQVIKLPQPKSAN